MTIDKTRRRAEALARMSAEPGPEGAGAKRRLDAIVRTHPDLAYLQDASALSTVCVATDVPTPMHVHLLLILTESHRCTALSADVPGTASEIPLARWSVTGTAADVRHTLQEYELHRDALLVLFDVLANTYLEGVLAEEVSKLDDEMDVDDEDGDDEQILKILASLMADQEPEPSRYDQYEGARRGHLNQILSRLPKSALRKTSEKLVHLSTPSRGTPAVMLADRAMAWNDPDMTFEQFLAAYRAMFPASQRFEYKLLYDFRDGYRLYPPTRRLRLCRELVKPEEWSP